MTAMKMNNGKVSVAHTTFPNMIMVWEVKQENEFKHYQTEEFY